MKANSQPSTVLTLMIFMKEVLEKQIECNPEEVC